MSPSVSVLLVNYLSGPCLAETLRGLAVQTVADFEAIVIDNGSVDESFAQARRAVEGDSRFLFHVAGSNIGFAAGNNLAATLAQAPWLALLNPDALPARDWLENLLAASRRHPDAVMFGSLQLDAVDSSRLDGAGDCYFFAGVPWRGGFRWPASTPLAEQEVFSPCAAAAMYRADAFRSVGGFDERFFCYIEDVDIAFRLRLAGNRCIQVPGAVVRHVGGASSGGGTSDFARRHGIRNMVWCFVKNMPAPLFWPLLPTHVGVMLLLLLKAALRGQAGVTAGALLEALRGLPALWDARRQTQRQRRASSRQIAQALSWSSWDYARRAPARPQGSESRLTPRYSQD